MSNQKISPKYTLHTLHEPREREESFITPPSYVSLTVERERGEERERAPGTRDFLVEMKRSSTTKFTMYNYKKNRTA
jgi:hypothetical protein